MQITDPAQIRKHPKGYSILVIEHNEEYELCQVDSNPQAIVRALKAKLQDPAPFQKIGAKKYCQVRFIKNPAGAS